MLPFHISQLLGFKSKTHGYALVNEQGIRLVFRDVADIRAKPDEEAESILIQWDNLVRCDIKKGFVTDALEIVVHVMFGKDPDGKPDNRIELEIEKRHREELERFQKLLREYQAGDRNDDVDEVLDNVRDLLDRM